MKSASDEGKSRTLNLLHEEDTCWSASECWLSALLCEKGTTVSKLWLLFKKGLLITLLEFLFMSVVLLELYCLFRKGVLRKKKKVPVFHYLLT